MRKIKKIRLMILSLLCISALFTVSCKKKNTGEPMTGKKSDMSGYSNFADQETHIYYDMTVKQMAEAMNEKRTFAVYFGYDTCEWCLDAVPVINEAAKESNQTVGYINTRAKPSWEKNTDIDDYDLLIEKVGEFLEYDENGIRHLYVPTLFFIKDGAVVEFHEGTLEGHNAKLRAMTAEEREELKQILLTKFAAMSDGEKTGS
jgi:predicted bacteriocin transport accessory protein